MTDINMLPDTHCFDDDSQTDVWSYSAGLVSELIEAAREEERTEIFAELREKGTCVEAHLTATLQVAVEVLEKISIDEAWTRTTTEALAKIKGSGTI